GGGEGRGEGGGRGVGGDRVQDQVARADQHVGVGAYLDVAEQDAAGGGRRVRGDAPRDGPARARGAQGVRIRDRDGPEGGGGEDVDVVVAGRAGRDGEHVDQDDPRAGGRVGDRDGLLGVAVRALPREHAVAAGAVEDVQVEVRGRVGRAADRGAERRGPGRDGDEVLLLVVVGDRGRVAEGA